MSAPAAGRVGPAIRAEARDLLRRLVACDTSNPPGRETKAAAILEDYLLDAGLECERVAKDPDRANLLVRLRGSGTGPSLAFLGHLDVVVARREEWSVEPFAAIERDGAIWGRGTVDMKCQVAATAVALATLARDGFRPNGDLMLLLMADEEVGDAGVGAPFFVETKPDLCPDFVVGEGAGERYDTPSGPIYLLDHGVKATASATLTVRGRPGDASLPDAGPNALYELARLLGRLQAHRSPVRIPPQVQPLIDALAPGAAAPEERLAEARAQHPALDRVLGALVGTTLQPSVLEAPAPQNVVPGQAVLTLACIVLPSTTEDELERELRDALGEGDYELEVVPPKGGSMSDEDSPLRDAIEAFLAEADPGARLIPALGYGYSDCHVLREAYASSVVGPGVGGGLVIDGQLYRGDTGYAGQIGHITAVPGGAPCPCGLRGCLSTVASSRAVAARLEPSHGPGLTVAGILELAAQGDADTREVLREAGAHTGRVLGALVNALNPARVILGGELGANSADLLEGTREALAEHIQAVAGRSMRVVHAELGDRSEVLGAATRVLRDDRHVSSFMAGA